MFDIGFLEIMVVLIIALLVIGPERMPELARKLGSLMGRLRRFINSVKEDGQMQETINDFKQSMNLDEQKKQISEIQKELQSGLDYGADIKLEDFQRPSFGGETPPVEAETGGQYNRAPSLPNTGKVQSPQTPTESAPQTTPSKTPEPVVATEPAPDLAQTVPDTQSETKTNTLASTDAPTPDSKQS